MTTRVQARNTLTPPPLCAANLTIGVSTDAAPYVMEEASEGIEIEILRAALAVKGYTFTPRQMSYHQLDEAVAQGELDAAATVLKKDDGTYYSDNFITFRNVAITRLSDAVTIHAVADLRGHSIVAWENAYKDLGPDFEELFSPAVEEPYREKYREFADQAQQVETFWTGQADVIVIDEAIMHWYTQQSGGEIDTSAELVYHRIFTDRSEYRISFRDEQVRDDFNAGLREIRRNGAWPRIYDRYLKQDGTP